MKRKAIELEKLATMFRRSAYNAWSNVLIGNAPQIVRDAYERMKDPRVGDLVIEASTVGGMRHENASDLDGIGILIKDVREPVTWSDPEFVWDEEVEGQPEPTERVYYIRTFDGREFRWTNARIIAVLTERMPLDIVTEPK